MSIGYRPGLDGIRAVAVLAVMGYHADISWLRGGYLGVDMFFVLSGFLITSLLVAELDRTRRIDFLAFWGRRARRLLPALFLVLLAVAIYAKWYAAAPVLPSIRKDGFATLAFVNNWRYAWNLGSYFDQFGLFPSPLRHTWSLAIEEQFYLVWPLVLAGGWHLFRHARDRGIALFRATVGLAAASALWMIVLYALTGDRSRVYFGTDTRAQGVLIGSSLALYAFARGLPAITGRRRLLNIAAWIVLAALIAGAGDAATWMYYGGFLLASLAAVVVVGAGAQPNGVFARALESKPFVLTGRISYGLYLWHWPVYVALGDTNLTGIQLLFARVFITFACATASYVLVERPIREWHRARRSPARRLGLVVAAPIVALLLVVGLLSATAPAGTIDPNRTISAHAPSSSPPLRAVMAGDSTMFTLLYYGDVPEKSGVDARGWAPLGCPFLPSDRVAGATPNADCRTWPAVWTRLENVFNPDLFVLEFGEWDVSEHVVDGVTMKPGDPVFRAAYVQRLEQARAIATRRGGRLLLLDVPCLPNAAPSTVDTFNGMIEAWAATHPRDVSVLHWSSYLCPDGHPATTAGRPLRVDGIHFSRQTAPIVSSWIAPRIRAATLDAHDARSRS